MSRFSRLPGLLSQDCRAAPVSPIANVVAVVVAVAVTVTLAGCAAAPVAHEEEAHELPAHHPRTFRRAIDAIEQRGTSVAAGGDAASRRELADIVRWLPLLATDTELGRADWDRVQGISNALAADLAAPAAIPAGFADRCREAVAGLREVAASLPAEVPGPVGPHAKEHVP
jgi:hypothetical protein